MHTNVAYHPYTAWHTAEASLHTLKTVVNTYFNLQANILASLHYFKVYFVVSSSTFKDMCDKCVKETKLESSVIRYLSSCC